MPLRPRFESNFLICEAGRWQPYSAGSYAVKSKNLLNYCPKVRVRSFLMPFHANRHIQTHTYRWLWLFLKSQATCMPNLHPAREPSSRVVSPHPALPASPCGQTHSHPGCQVFLFLHFPALPQRHLWVENGHIYFIIGYLEVDHH